MFVDLNLLRKSKYSPTVFRYGVSLRSLVPFNIKRGTTFAPPKTQHWDLSLRCNAIICLEYEPLGIYTMVTFIE